MSSGVWRDSVGRGLEEMADDDDHTFEKAEAGASATYPMQVLELVVFFGHADCEDRVVVS